MVILEKDVAQGENVPWASWFWFLFPSSIKSFIAFSFFYLAGWQLYHHRELLINLSAGRYFLIGIFIIIYAVCDTSNVSRSVKSILDFK